LRANRRASWLRHIDSRLDDDDMATTAQGMERRRRGGGGEKRRPCARRWRRRRVDTARRSGRNCREELRARRIYGAAASYSGAGGEIDRQRWKRAGSGAVGKWRAREEIFSRCVFVRVRRDAVRCSRRVTFGAPDSAKHRAHQKNCSAAANSAPAGGPIPSPRAVYWRVFSACAL
jgi:hypothetical protein